MIFEVDQAAGACFFRTRLWLSFVLEAAEFGKPFSEVVRFIVNHFRCMGRLFIFSGIYQNLVLLKGMPKIEKRLNGHDVCQGKGAGPGNV